MPYPQYITTHRVLIYTVYPEFRVSTLRMTLVYRPTSEQMILFWIANKHVFKLLLLVIYSKC